MTTFLDRTIYHASRPLYEGRLISVVRRGAGCGGRWGCRRFGATNPSAVQAAKSRRAKRASLGRKAARARSRAERAYPKGLVGTAEATSPRRREAPQRWLERLRPPGAWRSKPINTARGTPGNRHLVATTACVLKTHIVHRAAGRRVPRRSARPRYRGRWRKANSGYGVPRADKE